jgi:hypothetical protein
MLDISRTQVTDAGLEHIKGLTNLEQLWLIDTKVTDEGVEELEEALPQLQVIR